MLGARVGVRALTTRLRVSCFSKTFVTSSVCQPIAPPTLARHRRVSRGFKLTRPGSKPQRGRCHCASPQNKHDLWLSYAQRLRHRRGVRRSAPVRSVAEALGQLWSACCGRTLSSLGHPHSTTGRRYTDLLGPEAGAAYSFRSSSSGRRPTTPSISNIASPTISRQQPDTILSEHRLPWFYRGYGHR